MMRAALRMSFTALSLYVIAPAFAADPHDCIAVNGDAQRLACYDAALGRSGAASADAAAPPPAAAPTAAHDFGAEQLPRSPQDKSKAPDPTQANIKGNSAGWDPKTHFTPENGPT